MFIITIITLIAFSLVCSLCIDLHEENKRLRKWQQSRVEHDQRLSEEVFDSIRESCEEIQKNLEGQFKYFEERIVHLDDEIIDDTVTLLER
ncbi:hypothetical protein [Fictibacillus phosphorivorans]|uniref:hypothetical protein n=1 Tax=Fictibacillus phosphorivorans TaxID=1221500 RepID=UPI0011A45334|nr:hypothetical protein [Fictibacillus phosphorivorans]